MIVYALADPETREVRYVGETARALAQRVAQHRKTSRSKTTPPVNAWLRGLGVAPLAIEIESHVNECEMHDAEAYWIEQFRAMGARLLNIAPGGLARSGFRHTEEQKAKWRAQRRGENASHYGRRHSEETKARLSAMASERVALYGNPNVGRQASEETRSRISAGRKGIRPNFSEEGKRRRAEACRRNWEKPEYRALMTRPGASNPNCSPVMVDGQSYSQNELARLLGVSRCLVQKRIAAVGGSEMTMQDFARKRGVTPQ